LKRKLLLANILLLGLSSALVVHLRQQWLEDEAREEALLRQRLRAVSPPPLAPIRAAQPVKAAGYIDIAQKMLFSKDRNPVVVVEPPAPPPPKPMPPLPLFHGLVDLGDGPEAIMSENPKAQHRDYRPGDQIGPFKLIDVNSEEVTFGWDDKTITKKVDELLDRTIQQAPPAPVTTTAAPPVQVDAVGKPAPGADFGRGMRGCQAGDTSPAGTVAEGWVKVLKATPFGTHCYWEQAK
jgi:hypothetical protein